MDSQANHIVYSGLVGSAKAFAVEEQFREKGGQHLVICASKEDAAYFYNDLQLFSQFIGFYLLILFISVASVQNLILCSQVCVKIG